MPHTQEFSQNPESNSGSGSSLKCEFCGALEGERHPVRGFKVKITTPLGHPDGSMLACQVCRVAYRSEKQELKLDRSKTKSEKLIKRFKILLLTFLLIFGCMVLIVLVVILLDLLDVV